MSAPQPVKREGRIRVLVESAAMIIIALALYGVAKFLPVPFEIRWGQAVAPLFALGYVSFVGAALLYALYKGVQMRTVVPLSGVLILFLVGGGLLRGYVPSRDQKDITWWQQNKDMWQDAYESYQNSKEPKANFIPLPSSGTTQSHPFVATKPGEPTEQIAHFPVTLFGVDNSTGFIYAPGLDEPEQWMMNTQLVRWKDLGDGWFYVVGT